MGKKFETEGYVKDYHIDRAIALSTTKNITRISIYREIPKYPCRRYVDGTMNSKLVNVNFHKVKITIEETTQ